MRPKFDGEVFPTHYCGGKQQKSCTWQWPQFIFPFEMHCRPVILVNHSPPSLTPNRQFIYDLPPNVECGRTTGRAAFYFIVIGVH